MKYFKKIALLAVLSSAFMNHAYCDDKTEKENAEQEARIKSIKDSWNQLFNNVSEMKKVVVKNYNTYENEVKQPLQSNVNVVIDKKKGK